MAQPKTFNPYALSVGALIPTGLNAIITGLPANPTADQLVTQVVAFIETNYYPNLPSGSTVPTELSSVAYNAINSFRNSLVLNGNASFNYEQAPFIAMLIGREMTANLAPSSFIDRVADVEDNIGTSDLTVNDQTPLFLATTTGTNASNYWAAQLDLGSGSSWFPYFSTNSGKNYMNTLQWNVAAMSGALSGYGATPQGLIDPTTNIASVNFISSLIGALTITAGKLIFNWIPRITKPLVLNLEQISNLMPNNNSNAPIIAAAGLTQQPSKGYRCYCPPIDGTVISNHGGHRCLAE